MFLVLSSHWLFLVNVKCVETEAHLQSAGWLHYDEFLISSGMVGSPVLTTEQISDSSSQGWETSQKRGRWRKETLQSILSYLWSWDKVWSCWPGRASFCAMTGYFRIGLCEYSGRTSTGSVYIPLTGNTDKYLGPSWIWSQTQGQRATSSPWGKENSRFRQCCWWLNTQIQGLDSEFGSLSCHSDAEKPQESYFNLSAPQFLHL